MIVEIVVAYISDRGKLYFKKEYNELEKGNK